MTPTRDEHGTTLVEVLVTVMIIVIAFSALMGGLWTAVVASSSNVKLATAEATVRAFGEFMKRSDYTDCAQTYDWSEFFYPDEYSPSIVSIAYWDPGTESFQPPPCSTDQGMQLLTLQVLAPQSAANEQIQVVKRR